MRYKEHCKECLEEIGREWCVVHRWLDELARIYWPYMMHRIHRHHKGGVEAVRRRWGDEAAYAAELHIISDEGKVRSKKEMCFRYGIDDEESLKYGIDGARVGDEDE